MPATLPRWELRCGEQRKQQLAAAGECTRAVDPWRTQDPGRETPHTLDIWSSLAQLVTLGFLFCCCCLFSFGRAGSLLLCGLFSRCGKGGRYSSVAVSGLLTAVASCCGAQALGCIGFSGCGTQAWSLHRTWDLPGVEPMSILHWLTDSLPLSHQGSPVCLGFFWEGVLLLK